MADDTANWSAPPRGSAFRSSGSDRKSGGATGWTHSVGNAPERPNTAPNFQPDTQMQERFTERLTISSHHCLLSSHCMSDHYLPIPLLSGVVLITLLKRIYCYHDGQHCSQLCSIPCFLFANKQPLFTVSSRSIHTSCFYVKITKYLCSLDCLCTIIYFFFA